MSLTQRMFDAIQRRTLIYNACCEDPALDRAALDFQASDRVLVITSGGCNALDYLLAGAGGVDAVDLNPCQNALLELKIAAIRRLDYADAWQLFGQGRSPHAAEMYHDVLRRELSSWSKRFWDRRLHMFSGSLGRSSFYFYGGWGVVMWLLRCLRRWRALQPAVESLFQAASLQEQWELYAAGLRREIWSPRMSWALSRCWVHALLGIPPRQRQYILNYPGGLFRYGLALLDDLVANIPFATNYFMRANALGHYTPQCCPEYLSPQGFQRLKCSLADRLTIQTATLTEFLKRTKRRYSKFALLDHMDWLTHDELSQQWTALLARTTPNAKAIFRSALQEVGYLDAVPVETPSRPARLADVLHYNRQLAASLHRLDRVHLYGSFSIVTIG